MTRYRRQNLRVPHDIHYSWSGWPSGSPFPEASIHEAIPELAEALKQDGFAFESYALSPDRIQVTVCAGPDAAPVWVAQRIKGRLDYTLRKRACGVTFSRKVGLRAIGHNRTPVVEHYVRDQLKHVDLADPLYRKMLASVAVHDPSVDLSQPAESTHGRYWYNLHLVLVVAGRYRIGQQAVLEGLRERVLDECRNKNCAVKRVSIMPDHMHVALRGNPTLSPAEIALDVQERTSGAVGCRLWKHEFYVGTFGEYDYGAVKGAGGGIRYSS